MADLDGAGMSDGDCLHDEIVEDNSYIKNMIDLIPAQFYFDEETWHKVSKQCGKNTGNTEGLQVKGKRRHSGGTESKSQWKKSKYDPSASTSVTQIMNQLSTQKESSPGEVKHRSSVNSVPQAASEASTDDIRARFHDKLSKLKEKRKALSSGKSQEQKRLKRQEKKLKKKMVQKTKTNKATVGKEVTPKEKKGATPVKPVFNKEGKMVFSKFDFDETGKARQNNVPTGKNYKKLLDVLAKKKQKLEELKGKDGAKAKTEEEKAVWKNVLLKAEGTKIKDNPDLIKKSLKKAEKRKEKSKKEWKERDDRVKQTISDKQEKRQKNIQARKQSKIDKKIKRAKKKGRIFPGFS